MPCQPVVFEIQYTLCLLTRELRRRFVIACSAVAPAFVAAAPNEIKVFTDELARYREHTLEVHVNKASSAGPKASDQRTPLQIMPEYSYGVRRNWELSFQLPLAIDEGTGRLDGYRAELQYVAPHDEDEGFYWGFNAELARNERSGEEGFWSAELIPILGYRTGRWHFVANPGADKQLSGSSRAAKFQPAAKMAYQAFGWNSFGVEYYGGDQTRVLYFAWDGRIGKSDFNVGIGRGFTDASDRWVLKMIFEFAFR
jgi:hypothetical protein